MNHDRAMYEMARQLATGKIMSKDKIHKSESEIDVVYSAKR